ncbi:hypothetical protein D3C85_1050560 [compost metagenome]
MAGVGPVVVSQVADEVGLADQLEQVANARRKPALMLGQARAVGCQARHGIGRQRRHALLRGARGEQLGELLEALVDHRNVFIEVHQHPEHFLEVWIMVLQGVIQLACPDDDHLDLKGDHFWRQRYGRQATELTERRFHFQLARLQGTLERIPDKRLAQHLLGFQNQEAAVGAVESAGAQLAIGGVQGALVGAVFDTAEQVVVGRVWLEDHGRAATERMTDHQARCVLLFEQLARLGVGLGVVDQLLDHGAQQVHLNGLQVRADCGVLGVFFRQGRNGCKASVMVSSFSWRSWLLDSRFHCGRLASSSLRRSSSSEMSL